MDHPISRHRPSDHRPSCFSLNHQNILARRSTLLHQIRQWFFHRTFTEVDPPCLQKTPGLDVHVHGPSVTLMAPTNDPSAQSKTRYLHTSPEFACKKILAGGCDPIYYLGKVWRDGDCSAVHSPEFTMLEWYRKGVSYEAIMDDCITLIQNLCQALDVAHLSHKGRVCNPFHPWEKLSVREAIIRHYGFDILGSFDDDEQPSAAKLRTLCANHGVRVSPDDSWSEAFNKLAAGFECHLGIGRPTILYDYPAPEACLAQKSADNPLLAERFEIYIGGLEIANGFSELCDPAEQRQRFIEDQSLKKQLYGFCYDIDEELLEALPDMGKSAGVALGVDRLLMTLVGAHAIDQVLWMPVV